MGKQQRRVASPGLPAWPRLWIETTSGVAKIVCRHATWRSFEWAYRATKVVSYFLIAVTVACLWLALPIEQAGTKALTTFAFAIVTIYGLSPLTKTLLPGILARQVFPTRTTVLISFESIVFRSRLFTRPVIVWRYWKGRPVDIRFIIRPDIEASSYLADRNRERKHSRMQLDNAVVVEMVISSPVDQSSIATVGHQTIRRTIPLTEIAGPRAAQFSAVCTAALMITSQDAQRRDTRPKGADIDIF